MAILSVGDVDYLPLAKKLKQLGKVVVLGSWDDYEVNGPLKSVVDISMNYCEGMEVFSCV